MSAVTMKLPEGTPETTLTYEGLVDQPVTYKPSNRGTVQVERRHLRAFLRAIPGAKPASASAEDAVEQVEGQEAQVPGAAGAAAPRRTVPPR